MGGFEVQDFCPTAIDVVRIDGAEVCLADRSMASKATRSDH